MIGTDPPSDARSGFRKFARQAAVVGCILALGFAWATPGNLTAPVICLAIAAMMAVIGYAEFGPKHRRR